MSAGNSRNTITGELQEFDVEFAEDAQSWQGIYANMVQNSFEVGKNLQEVLESVLESALVVTKASAGMIMLQSDDGRHLIEVTSRGFEGDRPLICKKDHSIEEFLLEYIPKRNRLDSKSFSIIHLETKASEIGILALYFRNDAGNDPEIINLLELLRVNISEGIKRTRDFDVVKRRDLLTKASLMQLGRAMGSTLDIKRLSRQITQAAMAIVEADLCDILLLKEGSLEFQVASGFNKILKGFGNIPLKKDIAATIVKKNEPVLIKNIRSKSRFHERPWLNREQFKSYIGVPIKQDGKVIGVLEAFSRSASKFEHSDMKVLHSLVGPISASLRNIHLFEETTKKADELKILHTHISRIVAEKDISNMMKEIVNAARAAVDSLMAAAALFNPKTGHFEYRTSNIDPVLDAPVVNSDPTERFSYSEEVYAEILRTGKPIRLDDIKLHKGKTAKRKEDVPLRGFLGVPIINQNKKPCGIVMVSFKKDGSLFTETDEEVLTTLANQASIAIQNAQLYQQLEYRAKALKKLFSVSQKINASYDTKKIQKAVIEAVSNLFGIDSVCIALCDEADGEMRVSDCLIGGVQSDVQSRLVIDKENRAMLFNEKKPILVSCQGQSSVKLRLDNVPLKNYFNSFIGIPLVVQNRVIGLLGMSADWINSDDQSYDDLEILQIFANKVAIAMENSRLYEAALAEAEDLSTTLEVSNVITSETDINAIFKQIAKATKKIFKVKHGLVFLSDLTGEQLIPAYRWGTSTPIIKDKCLLVKESPLVGQAFIEKKRIMVGDLDQYNCGSCDFKGDMKSAVFIPLVAKGQASGVIALFSKERNFFDNESLTMMDIFINQFAIAIRNNQLYTRVIEEEVARHEAEFSVKLLEEKAKNLVVIEKAVEGIFMVDPDFRIQLFNPALEELTGKKAEKVIGKKCYDVFRDVYDKLCDKCPMYDNAQQPEKIKTNISNKNGENLFAEVNLSLIESNGTRGIIGTIRDITKEHELEVYQHDLRIATEVQKNILPSVKPEVKNLDIGFMCKPAKQIGGDYFDFIPLDNERVGIAIGDVAGKSLPAALLVSMHKYILRSAAANTSSVISPLRALNQILWEDTSPEVFVTTIYGVYNPTSSTFVYANAGHLPPLLSSDGSAKYLWAPQTPLGIQQSLFIEQQQVKLKTDDVLVLLSDGVTDIRNSKGDCYGFERLKRIVKKNSHLSAQGLADFIHEQTVSFSSGEFIDDFTIVVLKCTRTGKDSSDRELVVANKPIAVNDVRKFVVEELKNASLSKEDVSDVLVAVCEAVTNSVLHGQSPDGENNNIRVTCKLEKDIFKVTIKDNGIGYSPNLSEWRPPDLIRDRGRGIYLMQQLMDKVEFIPGDRGARIILTKNLPRFNS